MHVSHKPMRPSRRFLSLSQVIFVFLFLLPGAFAAHVRSLQSPTEQLPSKWNEAVRSLADRIAAASPARGALTFDLKNISSLSAADASSIRDAIQTELVHRGSRIAATPAVGTEVRLTFSEGADSYVWVAEWRAKEQPQIAIVAVPKALRAGDHGTKDSLRLESRMIWQQPAALLDFAAVTNSAGSYSTLITLEPGRLAFYLPADSQWQISGAVDVPHSKPWPRDVRGVIDVEGKRVQLADVLCTGDIQSPKEIRCSSSKDVSLQDRAAIRVSGHNESESALLGDRCDGHFVILASGNGDWTQPDTLQGYSLTDLEGQATASGSPIEFEGPVLALYREGKQSAARAIVHNLKTGNYEAYIVTATCSH
jgi:hypothetical protein